MINTILDFFNKQNKISNLKRKYLVNYFINKEHQSIFEENGYITIPNCINKEQIETLKDVYAKLELMNGFEVNDTFVNSGRFTENTIRNFVVDNIKTFSKNNLNHLFNINNCEVQNGGNFQIKPASSNSILNPHQDSPVIDETEYYAIFIWIPLENITLQNGPIWVLPKSHLWCNHQRSLNVKWPFEKHLKLLWKHMRPITLNAGDILCFDSALIHASTANKSNKTRVAITTTALPKNYQLVEYYKDEKTPKESVEKYFVDENYYINEDINTRPDNKYTFVGFENFLFNNISSSVIKQLLKKY